MKCAKVRCKSSGKSGGTERVASFFEQFPANDSSPGSLHCLYSTDRTSQHVLVDYDIHLHMIFGRVCVASPAECVKKIGE